MKLKNFRTIAVILVSDLLLLLKLREKKDSCKQDAICFVKALIPEAFWTSGGRSGPLERDLKRILCQHSRTVVEDSWNLMSNGSCVSIAFRLKRLIASVSICHFHIRHAIFETVNCIRQPVSASRLEWSEGKAEGQKGWSWDGSGKGWIHRPSPLL